MKIEFCTSEPSMPLAMGTMVSIDLAAKANWGNTEWWCGSYHENGLSELPKGDQVLCGVKFHITTKMMQLGCDQMSDAPGIIVGIPVGRKLDRLYYAKTEDRKCGPMCLAITAECP